VVALLFPAYYVGTEAYSWLTTTALVEDASYQQVDVEVPPPGQGGEGFDWDGYEDEDLAYWLALADGELVGRLVISAAGVDGPVIAGSSVSNLRRAVSWIETSSFPGLTGNFALAGHRTTYGAPFADIDALTTGDEIFFVSPYRIYRYAVTETAIVKPSDVEVIADTDEATITLVACHPRFSAQQRIVVSARLESVVRIAR